MSGDVSANGVRDLPAWVRRSWLVPLVIGLLLTAFGVVLLVNVNAGVRTLRWLVVVSLVLAAAEAFATASLRQRPWVGWLAGALYLAGAVVGTVWPGITLQVLAVVVGVALLVGGAVQAGFAWRAKQAAQGWAWGFALGVVAVLAGLVFLLGSPVITVVVLAVVLACYAIFAGMTLVTLSLAVRRLTGAVAS